MYRISTIIKVETDIFASIAKESEIFKSDVVVFIRNAIMVFDVILVYIFQCQILSVETDNVSQQDQKKSIYIADKSKYRDSSMLFIWFDILQFFFS